MRVQDYKGEVLWVIVDDGKPITAGVVKSDFREDWTVVKVFPRPEWRNGQNTQSRNLLAGIQVVKQFTEVTAVFIIEDDDYYSPRYLRCMADKLKGHKVTGEINTIYYNVERRGWGRNRNTQHSSLFQTAFTLEVLPIFEKICKDSPKFIDVLFWKSLFDPYALFGFEESNLAIGIKGLPGRPGIGVGHKRTYPINPDEDYSKLKELIGDDYKYYIQ
jgi:hypothetical protein